MTILNTSELRGSDPATQKTRSNLRELRHDRGKSMISFLRKVER
jgi:hypothetical protein